jgi:uncharacterized protein (TIGR02145 family)
MQTRSTPFVAIVTGLVALAGTPLGAQTVDDPETVTIGKQVWLARNLAVTRFANGDPIPRVTDSDDWAAAGAAGQPAQSAYDNAEARVARDGLLYNYAAIRDPRRLCPVGFRIPDDNDWATLEAALGKDVAAAKLKAAQYWPNTETGPGNGTDDVGFGGLPAGFRTQRGDFFLGDRVAYFWSLTELSPTTTTAHMLFDYDPKIFRIAYDKAMGMSVRCLKA